MMPDTVPNLLPFEGEAFYFPCFFSATESDAFFHVLAENEIDWKQQPIKIFGKSVLQPRLTAWYGDPEKSYCYSGVTMHPHAWTDTLWAIKNEADACAGVRFTSALLNYYRDGKDSMGWHRDNEKELGINPVIASVSLGAARTFQLRHYRDKKHLINLVLEHGSLLLMKGETQHYWEHGLPKTAKEKGPRINITFRVIY